MTKQHCENYSSFIGSSDISYLSLEHVVCNKKTKMEVSLLHDMLMIKVKNYKTQFWTIFA